MTGVFSRSSLKLPLPWGPRRCPLWFSAYSPTSSPQLPLHAAPLLNSSGLGPGHSPLPPPAIREPPAGVRVTPRSVSILTSHIYISSLDLTITQLTLLDVCPWGDTPKCSIPMAKPSGSLAHLPSTFSPPCNSPAQKIAALPTPSFMSNRVWESPMILLYPRVPKSIPSPGPAASKISLELAHLYGYIAAPRPSPEHCHLWPASWSPLLHLQTQEKELLRLREQHVPANIHQTPRRLAPGETTEVAVSGERTG